MNFAQHDALQSRSAMTCPPDPARRVEPGQRAPAVQEDPDAARALAEWLRLVNELLHRQAAWSMDTPASKDHAGLGLDSGADSDARFNQLLLRLQRAWYAGHDGSVPLAVRTAGALPHSGLPAADRLGYHLFAILVLSRCGEAGAVDDLDVHCAALRRLADAMPAGAGGFVSLAKAARQRCSGDGYGALRDFDQAGVAAGGQGMHGIAALAWEEAALQAREAGLVSAMAHYRRQAIASLECWGAPGRAAMLARSWREPGAAGVAGVADVADVAAVAHAGQQAELRAERERTLRAGSIGELGLSIAHEVNQPLAAISLHAAAATKWLRRPQPDIERALSSLALISAAGRHAGDIVRSVQCLASQQESEMDSVPVDRIVADALQLLQRPLRKAGIGVELALGLGDCTIYASRVQLHQVVTNLLVNAIEALAGSGATEALKRIRVQTRRCGEQEIEITVADNGPGIAPQHRDRVFGSLFSTKPNSTGMGLSISLAIARAHRGQMAYEPIEPQGACFRVRLPVRPLPAGCGGL